MKNLNCEGERYKELINKVFSTSISAFFSILAVIFYIVFNFVSLILKFLRKIFFDLVNQIYLKIIGIMAIIVLIHLIIFLS